MRVFQGMEHSTILRIGGRSEAQILPINIMDCQSRKDPKISPTLDEYIDNLDNF